MIAIEELETIPAEPPPLLRQLVDLRDRQIQKARIQFTLRLSALDRGTDGAESANKALDTQREVITRYRDWLQDIEDEIDEDIAKMVRSYPIYADVSKVKGIGPMMAAKLIALIDIRKADTVSALWRFAGLAVIDGEREKPAKGEKLHYSIRLKTTVFLVGQSFMRSNSPYRQVYDTSKAGYEANRPDWTKMHIHLAAQRRMTKLFLSHLWERWRELEGLPTRKAFVLEQLGHTHEQRAEAFGWP